VTRPVGSVDVTARTSPVGPSDRLPDAPEGSFASDNAAGVAPEVMAALAEANTPAALAYGQDRWSAELVERFRELFDAPVETLVCWGGTGANVVGLASVLQPWQAEPSDDGKLTPESLDRHLPWRGVEHHPQPAVVSISQVTEMGTVYTSEQIAALAEACHRAGLLLHLDGARLANAVAATGDGPDVMVREAGVDVMTFGATKNGAMYGEAVVWLRPELADRARFIRKQAGQLPSKARFIAAQLLALLDDDLWIRLAAHANAMARDLADRVATIDGVVLENEPAANAVFARLPAAAIGPLQDWSFFWPWDPARDMVRWMTSFATTTEDVERFAAGVAAVMARHR